MKEKQTNKQINYRENQRVDRRCNPIKVRDGAMIRFEERPERLDDDVVVVTKVVESGDRSKTGGRRITKKI